MSNAFASLLRTQGAHRAAHRALALERALRGGALLRLAALPVALRVLAHRLAHRLRARNLRGPELR